ncbi:MAG: EAL domain-containing protein [Lachnospiraceae bacterium]|nr:EAL domain-containing protein [Lachnospiraceae bacterium]
MKDNSQCGQSEEDAVVITLEDMLASAQIGALYVDDSLYIRKIMPMMMKYTDLQPEDVGRSILHVNFIEGYQTLEIDIRNAMQTGDFVERAFFINGQNRLLRIYPHFAAEGVCGTVLILSDITQSLKATKHELQVLMSSIPGGVCRFVYDGGLMLEYANEGMFALMKVTPEEFATSYDNRYEKVMDAAQWAELQEKIENTHNGEVLQMEYAVHYIDRGEEWRLMQAVVLECCNRRILQCVVADITELKTTYFRLEQEKEKLNIIAEMSGDLLFEYDIEKDIMQYTKQSESIINEDEIVKNYTETISRTGYMHPAEKDKLEQFCKALRMGKKHIHAELRKKYRDGRYHWVEVQGTTICDFAGKPVKVIGHTKNIDERKKSEEQYRRNLERDSMTGLYNRQAIMEKVQSRLDKKPAGQSDWLMVVDVDNFKLLNEKNGHLVGDTVLCMVADELKNTFKKGLIGRIGGDEFVVYLENISREKLEQTLGLLNDTIQRLYKDTAQNMETSCSTGVVWRSDIDDFDTLLSWADYALYQVKQDVKNGYYIVTPRREEPLPEVGYLDKMPEADYVHEEAIIKSDEELVVFTLELLANVSDMDSSLKMVSDRICSFYDIDDIAYIALHDEEKSKKYHWSRRDKRQTAARVLQDSEEAWAYIQSHFDAKGMLALRKSEISKMPGEQVGSILFVRADREQEAKGYVAFVDRVQDRDWEQEKENLQKLAGILVNHLYQLYDEEKEKDEIDHRINYDGLTGMPKYQKFIALAEEQMQKMPQEKYYFVYSDFANFQYVNEVYGYTEGDKILAAFAQRINNMPGCIWITRVTSDHFVCLYQGGSEESIQTAYLEATSEFCKEMNQKYDQCNLIMVSGLSSAKEGEAPSYAIDRANVARKYGKDTANTVVMVYNQKIKDKNEAEKSISANMVAAMENGEFKAWLQPKVSLRTGKVVGAEALVRWQRTDGSMIYPDKFIPVFEKNGFITSVDFAVLEQVLAYLREAMDNGEQVVPVSVNFSRRHNEDADFVDTVVSNLEKYRIPPEYLEAELTESIFMLDLETLTNNIHKLKEKGIAISIDDFGSGYSSLNVLANVEADIIKLDRIFLNYADDDKKAPVFVKYLVKMMKHMGYQVIAEGVETKEQISLLSNADCDMVQGYYYAKPMPIPAFREFLKEFNKET